MIEKNQNDLIGVLFRKYPDFILNDRKQLLADIPAFVFHDVTIELLEPMFEFLAENSYLTLAADEYVERKIRGQRAQEREVLLTFDDGYKSLYAVVYPVLKRYGLKAVAYIVPGMTPDRKGDDNPEFLGASLCNWQEIREMHDSGVVDIQSHSMYHHSVAISHKLIDFVRPGVKCSFLKSDLVPLMRQNESKEVLKPAFGTPIYDWGARYGAAPAYQEGPFVAVACCQYVKEHGGRLFFENPNWRRRLKSVWAAARREDDSARFEDLKEQRMSILQDLLDSKNEIERRLPGKVVRHFCYPWFRAAPLSVRLSTEAGYVSNAWASILPRFVRTTHVSIPTSIPRFSPYYVWRLPGKGRRPIKDLLWERVCGRSRTLLSSSTSMRSRCPTDALNTWAARFVIVSKELRPMERNGKQNE
jgi:peptidoglycan/xylan/chitin deacetylase (PgdA/CDA1 family)